MRLRGLASQIMTDPALLHRGRIMAAALSFLVFLGSGVAWAMYQDFSAHVPHGLPVPSLAAGHPDLDGQDQNILLVGSDSRLGATPAELKQLATIADGGTVNSDTIMVLHVPADGSRPTIVSFPRDSWVEIPGHGQGKLNSAYPYGFNAAQHAGRGLREAESAGIVLTIQALEQLTGLHIDHYVQVDLLGFYRISEAIGGVPVCLLHAQNAHTDSDADGSGYSGINLPAGRSVIKGTQALAFVRQRHGLPNGDLDRIRRQQYFLSAAFDKITSTGTLLNPFKLTALLHAVQSSLLTDPALDVVALARQFASLADGNISFVTVPNDGAQVIYPDGVETSIVAINKAAMPAFIATLRGQAVDNSLKSVAPARPATVTVDVLNGTDGVGLATRNADQLTALGFHTNNVGSAPPTNTTVVEYPAGGAAAAKAVAAVVPGAHVLQTSAVQRTTLILGSDGHQVRGAISESTPAPPANSSSVPPVAAAVPTSTAGCID